MSKKSARRGSFKTRSPSNPSGAWPLGISVVVLGAPLWISACATSSCDEKLSCEPWSGADAQSDGRREAQTSNAPADAGSESANSDGSADANLDGSIAPEQDSAPDANSDLAVITLVDGEDGSTLDSSQASDAGTDSGTDDGFDSSAKSAATDAAGPGADSSDGAG